MLRALFINFALLIAMTYLFSLTLRSWPLRRDRTFQVQTITAASLVSVILLLQPAAIAPGVLIDLRPVPLVYLALVYGAPAALVGSIPVLTYRYFLGGPGITPAFTSIALILLVTAILRRLVQPRLDHISWSRGIFLGLVSLAPNGLPLVMLPNGMQLLQQVYPPLLILNVAAFLIVALVLRDRIKLIKLNAMFQRQARQDALSGLFNRRQFDLDLLALRTGDLLLMVDIDHFKRINDTYGHAVGDQVITAVGELLRSNLRASDSAYRYGGEEFVLLVHQPQIGTPELIAERIRAHIEQTPLSVPSLNGLQGDPATFTLHLTASLGGARHMAGTDPQHTLALADQALYQAKQGGRNRWVLHPEPQLGLPG
ncbi:GGDEF domain-containing protein [Deinococcus sp. SL84]|uniref:GGDEF domain-containing protein n=1 Tax=Deinococcus sp. SL84 TaxID=2994663 RepID=UPI002272E889|nr:diguanylate cyclase [Deinococcus sp. SL84]MCY1704209.1 diguanylate cyclase [Deinococcus sp. SL84]